MHALDPGRARTLSALLLSAMAVGLSGWMGLESRAGSETIVVATLGLAGTLASILAVIVAGSSSSD